MRAGGDLETGVGWAVVQTPPLGPPPRTSVTGHAWRASLGEEGRGSFFVASGVVRWPEGRGLVGEGPTETPASKSGGSAPGRPRAARAGSLRVERQASGPRVAVAAAAAAVVASPSLGPTGFSGRRARAGREGRPRPVTAPAERHAVARRVLLALVLAHARSWVKTRTAALAPRRSIQLLPTPPPTPTTSQSPVTELPFRTSHSPRRRTPRNPSLLLGALPGRGVCFFHVRPTEGLGAATGPPYVKEDDFSDGRGDCGGLVGWRSFC